MQRLMWIGLVVSVVLASGYAQSDPATRPKLMWHIGATRGHRPLAFTEDGQFLLAATQGRLVQVYRVSGLSGSSILDGSTPLGHALTTYDYSPTWHVQFTDRTDLTDVNANQEYVVGFSDGQIHVWRFVRGSHPSVFRGAYLDRRRDFSVPGWAVDRYGYSSWNGDYSALMLRGDRTDRRYNRLAAAGDSSGNLRIVLINPQQQGNQLTPVVVNNAHYAAITSLVYDASSRVLYSGGADGLIRRWQVGIDAQGRPSLTLLQTVAAHWGAMTLALTTVSGVRYLVSVSEDQTMAGWRLGSGGALPATPTWIRAIESLDTYDLPYTDVRYLPRVRSTPYGDLEWALLLLNFRGDYARSLHFLIKPDTGDVVALLGSTFFDNIAYYTDFLGHWLISPVVGGQRYIVHTANIAYSDSLLGFTPLRFGVRLVESTSRPPVSALHLPASGNTYVAGFADGSVRLYVLGGNAPTASATLHSNRRVVGARLIPAGSVTYTLTVSIDGQLVLAQASGAALNPVLTRDLTAETPAFSSVHTLDYLPAQGLVAIGGSGTDGRPLVRTLRLSLGSPPTLSADASFAIANESGPVASVRILASQDLVLSTGNRVSRWNRSGSGYAHTRNYTVSWPNSAALAVGNEGYLWAGMMQYSHYPTIRRVDNDAEVWNAQQSGDDRRYFTRAYPIEALGDEEAVWGMALRTASGDTGYLVARGRPLLQDRDSVSQNTLHIGWRFLMPDAVEALAARGETVIAGLANGQLYECIMPSIPLTRTSYDTVSARFSLVGNQIIAYLTEFPNRHYAHIYTGASRVARLRLSDGVVQSQSFEGFDITAIWNTTVQLTPSQGVIYGYLPGGALWAKNASTFAPLCANTALSPNRWWLTAVDDQRAGLLHGENARTQVINNQTYYRWRPVIEFYQHSNNPNAPATLAAQRPLDPDTEIGVWHIYGGPLTNLRWDMNANRTLIALLSDHNEWTGTNFVGSRRLVILQRQGAGWASWTLRTVLRTRNANNQNDFVSGNPTYVRFHPTVPNVLYVGLDSGRVRVYFLDANGQVAQVREYNPTRGNPGSIGALDVGEVVLQGRRYSIVAFGGPNGLSTWATSVCRPDLFNEVHFYDQDIAFFSDGGYLQVSQDSPNSPPIIVYGNGLSLSAANLENIPLPGCLEDINADGSVDDADLLSVLFAFGQAGYIPADVNCDGIVDDADLLMVLFVFGSSC